ncbi:VanZ family protein [Acetivibrio straminisolvens]|uniref:Acetobutylicum phosphotransbutyrylase n=1 Tax=Acetivibrio straminisolvens JCM 21531 TaxID=1294263 RepID=W4V9R4_9FIRM|nr:VanZ family protein [Acetivibrio straminisolvens]GAE89922.1 acetobutylicum phosphotransbutyrylase [Acetivibrio straminisolvens JCM 21531]
MKKAKVVLVFAAWIAVIGMIIIILGFSSQNGLDSVSTSETIVDKIISFLNLDDVLTKNEVLMENRNYLFRKAMHFTEYFILALLAFNALRFVRLNKAKASVFAMLIACSTAVIDELYQRTIPGRNPQILDVFIDSAGALAAVLICSFLLERM